MDHASELNGILAGAGIAPEQVADTLRNAGIRGVRNTVRFLNPIVRYCQSLLSRQDVSLDVIQPDMLRIRFPDKRTTQLPLTPSVKQFLDRFNSGAFPDLEFPPQQFAPHHE
jgi:hypothetical protein